MRFSIFKINILSHLNQGFLLHGVKSILINLLMQKIKIQLPCETSLLFLFYYCGMKMPFFCNLNKLPKPLFLLLLVFCLSSLFRMKLLITLLKAFLPRLSMHHPSLCPHLPFFHGYIFTLPVPSSKHNQVFHALPALFMKNYKKHLHYFV